MTRIDLSPRTLPARRRVAARTQREVWSKIHSRPELALGRPISGVRRADEERRSSGYWRTAQ